MMKTKIDIVCGFLGSGKTTFIRKLIAEEYNNEKVVVIENEFGKVNIDGIALKNSGIIVHEITSGCICCSLSGDFNTSIIEVIGRFNPQRIIIEPTGIADLSEIIKNFNNSSSALFELKHLITIVDVKSFKLRISYSKDFFENQIKASANILLSKTTGLDDEYINEVIDTIKAINSSVNIINLQWNEVMAGDILNALENTNSSSEPNFHEIKEKSLGKTFISCEIETLMKFNESSLQGIFNTMNDEEQFGTIIRAKGILDGINNRSFKFDFVNNQLNFEICNLNSIGKICIIGFNLNENKITNLFNKQRVPCK